MISRKILTVALFVAVPYSFAQGEVIGFDNGETSSYLSFSQSDDPVADGWSPGDWFGWASRDSWPQAAGMPFALADDSVVDISGNGAGSPFPGDNQGIVDSTFDPSNQFFGVVDTVNGNNADDLATATWTFDISGYSNIGISADFAAMGDFESFDIFQFSYSIDGSPAEIFFDFIAEEDLMQSYTMESGAVVDVDDPLSLQGVLLNDVLQTFTASLAGTGSILTIEFFEVMANGGSEAFLFDNLTVTGVFEPALPALLGAGLLAFGLARRRAANAG